MTYYPWIDMSIVKGHRTSGSCHAVPGVSRMSSPPCCADGSETLPARLDVAGSRVPPNGCRHRDGAILLRCGCRTGMEKQQRRRRQLVRAGTAAQCSVGAAFGHGDDRPHHRLVRRDPWRTVVAAGRRQFPGTTAKRHAARQAGTGTSLKTCYWIWLIWCSLMPRMKSGSGMN